MNAELIADIQKGNIRAFKQLFDDYFPILCVYAQRFIADPEPCKDIVQEVLLTYWERRKDFNEIHRLKSFLYTATRNQCVNVLKHDSYIEPNFDQTIFASHIDEIEDEIIRQETFLLVRKAVATLPTQMQRVIRLSLQGKHNSEIAQILNIAEGTVHSLKKTAYKKLRASLGECLFLLLFLRIHQ